MRSLGRAVLLGAVLLCTGCVTLGPGPGGCLVEDSHAFFGWNDTRTSPHGPAERASHLPSAGPAPSCGGQAVPRGWPAFSSGDSEARLAPFFTCTSPAEYVALQERVDMPRLVESLPDWEAVRLGALGPVREDAAPVLNRKRLAFILHTTDMYGAALAEVFIRFLLDSAHDDELRELLFWLARDKRLETTLGQMPRAQVELEARGLKLSARPDRDFQAGDLLRGAGHSVAELLAHEQVKNARYTRYSWQRGQLPRSYQQDLDEVEQEAAWRHFSAGNVALGSVDHLTFGVPLGLYYLGVGTGHGLNSLSRGEYEQAVRELTPLALLATVYAGGKGVRALHEARAGGGLPGRRVTVRERVEFLAGKARQLQARLGAGEEGLLELSRYIQARREAGHFVAVGGMDAALALYEARGDVARARPLLSKARPDTPGSSSLKALTPESQGRLASLVDEGVGHTRAVVEAKLAAAEGEAPGPRLPRNVGVLEKHRPALDAPPPEARGHSRWREYVDYYERRLGEVKKGEALEGPLHWAPYERMRAWFARGLAFERDMVKRLREDAEKPRAERRFLRDFDKPRVETQVGVRKTEAGLRYADVLVIEEGELGGRPRRVETFSFKSRDFSGLKYGALEAQMIEDAREALRKYGVRLDVRRSSLQSLFPENSEVPVQRVRLVYEGGGFKPMDMNDLKKAIAEARKEVPGVEVLFP